MRCLASLVVCATLSQVLWIGLSGGQDIDCTKVDEKSECCSSQNTCVYVNCTVNSKAVAACYNSTEGASCDEAEKAVDSCGSDVTTPAKPEEEATDAPTPEEKVDCSTYNNRKECCAAGNSTACVFFSCTDENNDVVSKECIAADATPSCSDDNYSVENLCKTDETPEGEGEKTPEGEGEKTPEVDCAASSSDENACCSAGNSTACIFLRCTSADGNVTGTLCMAAASTPACPEQTDTPSANICEQSGGPTTGPENQNATKSPTTGEEAGGQSFDAASFIGGIVLCAGILAIGYFGLKFYRSRQERNYESM